MANSIYKIYNSDDFNRITQGIKVARFMQMPSSFEPDDNKEVCIELVVSNSLCCSYCNTDFENQDEQRNHYKLNWHCCNLKRHLNGLKSISEDSFNKLSGEDDTSSMSDSESYEEYDIETSGTEIPNEQIKDEPTSRSSVPNRSKKISECDQEISKEEKLQAIANRHTKVFFENDDGKIFSIYRCLLHHKKDIPQKNSDMIAQALDSGKRTKWTIIMIGGGSFAAAVFHDGEPIVHKTFHTYTVRAKQGFAQSSRSNAKSAGASLRRYNETSFVQHVQEILDLWSMHTINSSVILYRAVGRENRKVLFGGKNPPFSKNDIRLRKLPFPTCKATFKEVMRVYDILSTIEVYGPAADFMDCFPISPRQPIRKKISKLEMMNEVPEADASSDHSFQENKTIAQSTPQHRNPRPPIDRAKPRKSPNRPLPDIILKLAQSSSESDLDLKHDSTDISLIEQNFEVDFVENLLAFQDTVPRYLKKKKTCRQKKKVKKETPIINEILLDAKTKLWNACKLGDNELLSSIIEKLMAKVKECEEEQNKEDDVAGSASSPSNIALVNAEDVTRLFNDMNEDGNTLLHLAAIGGYHDQVWLLLDVGSNPCNKNKKLQTPYAAATDKKTRNTFRKFMEANPDKYNYQKSQIPGPLSDEIEQAQAEKKKQQRKMKRIKDKIKKKEVDLKKQEENEKQRFLSLPDTEKRALLVGNRMLNAGYSVMSRCFQCAIDMTDSKPFHYDDYCFCSMLCLKEHRTPKKTVT